MFGEARDSSYPLIKNGIKVVAKVSNCILAVDAARSPYLAYAISWQSPNIQDRVSEINRYRKILDKRLDKVGGRF